MKCRYCNVVLAPLRSLTDGEFCCDGHRETCREREEELVHLSSLPTADSLVRLHVALTGAPADIPTRAANLSQAQDFQTEMRRPVGFPVEAKPADEHTGLPGVDRLLPLNVTQTAAQWQAGPTAAAPSEWRFTGSAI